MFSNGGGWDGGAPDSPDLDPHLITVLPIIFLNMISCVMQLFIFNHMDLSISASMLYMLTIIAWQDGFIRNYM